MPSQDLLHGLPSSPQGLQHPTQEVVQEQQAEPAVPSVPVHERVTQQLQECLPQACPTPVKLQFVVSQLMQHTSTGHQGHASREQEEQVCLRCVEFPTLATQHCHSVTTPIS
jgi:hypothetical protein